MPSKLNARVSFKHGTQADWEKAENFIPYDRELIVYDCDETHDYERVKLGDGVYNPQTGKVEGTNINDLPFLTFGFKTSKEGNYQFGTKADNLTSTSEHSIVSGSNISAGIRGLKIKNTIMLEGNQLQVYPVDEEASKIYEFYNVASLVGARIAFVLNHHSFEQYEVIGWDNNGKCFYCSRFDGKDSIPEYFELAYEEDEVTPWEHGNYMWFYTREDNGSITTFDVSLNDNAPIRPEADFTYALGDNIQVVGRSSFSSGQGNQNMGWYSATMGRFNTAYYSAFALGAFNNATGTYAVALNQNTEASAVAATSKGYLTKATANYSEAGGQGTEANHKASFTHGFHTKSGRQHQAVFGEHNEINKTALFVVGNGVGEIKQTVSKTLPADWNDPANSVYPQPLEFIPSEWSATYTAYKISDNTEISGSCGDGIVNLDIREGELDIYGCVYDTTQVRDVVVELTYSIINQAENKSNAFTVEPDGSAIVQTQGKSNNAVVIKQTLDTELNKKASEIAKDINDAIVDASNAARDLDSASRRYTDSLGDYFIIEDEWLDTCVQSINQERGNYFITKFDANATSGGVIKHSTNYIKEYTDNFKYSLDVYVAEANTSVSGFGNAVGPHINIGTFDGIEVYIQFRVGSLFLWGVEKLGDKIQTTGLGTTISPAQVTGATIEVGKNYKVEVEKNGSTLFCTVGEYHFTFAEKQSLTFVPNFLINCRYANCTINNRKLVSRDNKLQSLAGKDELNSAFVDAKKYTDSKLASGYSIITNNIEAECIIEHLDISNLTGQSCDLGHTNIVPGSVEIIPHGDAPTYDSGNGILYRISSGRETYLIDYKTGIISNIPKLGLYTDCEIRFKYYIYNDVNSPSTNALNSFTDNKIENYFSKFNNYIIENNNYIHLEDINAERELYGSVNGECNEFFELNNKGFINARFTEKENTGGIPGANPNNTVNRYITLSNNYVNAYEDFLVKIDIDLKDIYASQTGLKGATGPIIFPFENAAGIQFRQNGSIVYSYGGTTSVITDKQINKIGKYTIYFKYMKALGILNIYKDSLDNLLASIQLTDTERANMKPQLAFGGRCCTYSAECEIHKAELELKPIKKADYELITNKDPYKYYMIEE